MPEPKDFLPLPPWEGPPIPRIHAFGKTRVEPIDAKLIGGWGEELRSLRRDVSTARELALARGQIEYGNEKDIRMRRLFKEVSDALTAFEVFESELRRGEI